MLINGTGIHRHYLPYFFIAHHIMIKTFSNLDKTHCQKSLSLEVPYFVTEVIFGQKFIDLLWQISLSFVMQCIQLNSMEFMSFLVLCLNNENFNFL